MNIVETRKDYEISFPVGPNFHQMLAAVKAIPNSWFQGATKTWHVPRHRESEVKELKILFGVDDGSNDISRLPEVAGEVMPLPELTIDIPLERKLLPFQGPAVAYGLDRKRFLNGDQMGLCKTATAIATVVAAQAFPCLIICPATLKLNWQKEWNITAGRKAMVLKDSVKRSWPMFYEVGRIDVFITNFESLKKYFILDIKKEKDAQGNEMPMKLKHITFTDKIKLFKSVIVDESHKIRNETDQSTFTMGMMLDKEYRILLSGTPLVNGPRDLISQLYAIGRLSDVVSHIPLPKDRYGRPHDFSGKKRFEDRYCASKNGTNLKELNNRLNMHCYFRREKSEVMKDLPPKIRQVISVEITNRKEYDLAEKNFIKYLKEVKQCTDQQVKKKLAGQWMVQMGVLKDVSARGKIEAVSEHIAEITGSGQKAVIFCHLKEVRQVLHRLYPNSVQVHGEMSAEQKDRAVVSFQNDIRIKEILVSMKAGSEGITLTASSNGCFIELPWTFAVCEQCEDRMHRQGQRDSVQASYFLGYKTIDEYIYNDIIMAKKGMMEDVAGATDTAINEHIDRLLTLFSNRD